jgi:hypothetical protein
LPGEHQLHELSFHFKTGFGGLCNEMPETVKIEKIGSYPSSPSYRFQAFRCKARVANARKKLHWIYPS